METWWQTHDVRRLVMYVASRTNNTESRLMHGNVNRTHGWDGPTLQWAPCLRQCYIQLDELERAQTELIHVCHTEAHTEIDEQLNAISNAIMTGIERNEEVNKALVHDREKLVIDIRKTWTAFMERNNGITFGTVKLILEAFQGDKEVYNMSNDLREIHNRINGILRDEQETDEGYAKSFKSCMFTFVLVDHLETHNYIVECINKLLQHPAEPDQEPDQETAQPSLNAVTTDSLTHDIINDLVIMRDAEAMYTRLLDQWPSLRHPGFNLGHMLSPTHNVLWNAFADLIVARVALVDKSTGRKPDYKGADDQLLMRASVLINMFENAYIRMREGKLYLDTPNRKCGEVSYSLKVGN